ncbi:MAG: adenylate/guanylate cyclase domain-containing protein [Bacteroidetes bacterium]|nr:adenylate/guanylate cyclase domain-containing protein [Bacteroidota bacterium]MBU1114523.1 adenylate/guanylate cyclase domain-containing protein [Bacteroidota bacterium]MBU1799707.1 adenylate/guanylate cyclase domain-containing protein [Bacteroidota bacterium]
MNRYKRKIKKILPSVIIPLGTALIVILLTQDIFFSIKPIQELELKYLDIRFSKKDVKDIKDSADVIILGITQDDFDQIPEPYNSWPWPRSYFAKVVNNLKNAGVKAVGIDVLMSNDDKFSPQNDKLFEEAILNSRNVVVAGQLDVEAEMQYEIGNYSIKKQSYNYRNKFFAVDSSVGIVQIGSDEDGIYRRYEPLVISGANESILPTFSFAILNKYYGLKGNNIVSISNSYFKLLNIEIPRYDKSSMLINYYGPNGTFEYLKFSDVLDDKDFKTKDEIYYDTDINIWDDEFSGLLQSGKFKNKIVLIGSTMPEDKDFHPTAFGQGKRKGDNQIWGVEIHANAIQNVIWNDFLIKESKIIEILSIIILSFFSFFIFSLFKQNKKLNIILAELINITFLTFLFVGFYFLGIYLFVEHDYIVSFISPIATIIFGYFSTTAYNVISVRKHNAMIKGMFGKYVSKSLVTELLNNPEKLSLGGVKKNITIMFSDIEGFTSISEKMKPEELVEFINNYLSIMTSIVLEHKGTLDKYLGDSLMAFWGAPLDVEDKELNACITAILMQKKMDELKNGFSSEVTTKVKTRIGINGDDVVVGNIGGIERFDYTVMGDGVNLASRLESANKLYGTSIMISEAIYQKVAEEVVVRTIDKIVVKGKTKPIIVYELLGLKNDKEALEKLNLFQNYIDGYKQYKSRNFESAKIYFQKSLLTNPNDLLSKIYLERSENYILNPPESNWDGVSHLTSK